MQSTVRKSAYNFIQHYTTIPALCKHLFFARTNLSHFDQKITHSLTTLHKHPGRALYVRPKRYAISAGERNSPLQNAAANRSGRTGRRGRPPLHHVSVNCFVRCGRPKGAPTGRRRRRFRMARGSRKGKKINPTFPSGFEDEIKRKICVEQKKGDNKTSDK